jgi:hypothetical protein
MIIFSPFAFMLAGALVMALPARWLMKFDRTFAWSFYAKAPNPDVGLRRAKIFYRIVGLCLVAIGLIIIGAFVAFVAFFKPNIPICC